MRRCPPGASAWRVGTDDDGDSDELRSGSGKTQEGLDGESALEGYSPRLQRRGRRAVARVAPRRAHARATRCREAMEARHRGAICQLARRHEWQPGDAAGEGRPQGDLSIRMAGG